jgi:MFS family permease
MSFFRQKLPMLFLIVVIVTVGQISNDIYLPSFNSISLEYNVPIHLIERTIVMFMIGFTIGTLITGPLSDQYGRKNIILISSFIHNFKFIKITKFNISKKFICS